MLKPRYLNENAYIYLNPYVPPIFKKAYNMQKTKNFLATTKYISLYIWQVMSGLAALSGVGPCSSSFIMFQSFQWPRAPPEFDPWLWWGIMGGTLASSTTMLQIGRAHV